MKQLAAAIILMISGTTQASAIDPVQECELYMKALDVVSEVTGEVVSVENPAHRGILAAVMTLSQELMLGETEDQAFIIDDVRSSVLSVVESGGHGCTED